MGHVQQTMASDTSTTSPQRHSATLTHGDWSNNGQLLPAQSQGCSAWNLLQQPGRAARTCPRRPGAQHAQAEPSGLRHCAPHAHGRPTTHSTATLNEMLPPEPTPAARPPVQGLAGSGAEPPAPSAQVAQVAPQGRQATPQANPRSHEAEQGPPAAGQQTMSPLGDESIARASGSNPHSDGHAHAPPLLRCG